MKTMKRRMTVMIGAEIEEEKLATVEEAAHNSFKLPAIIKGMPVDTVQEAQSHVIFSPN